VQILLLFVSLVLLASALVGERGLVATYRARRQAQALVADIEALRTENAALRQEAHHLQADPGAIERAARRDLGLVRPGEVVVLIAKP
jgi:cell division protein FtsB